jgi:hypothetical protein
MTNDAALAEAPDPAVLRAERRLRMLEELSGIGMDLARALHRRAFAAADPQEPAAPDDCETSDRPAGSAGDPSVAFARISRAIRLTLALEARADEALRALRAGERRRSARPGASRRVTARRRTRRRGARVAATRSNAWCSRRPSGRSTTRRP